MKEEEKKTCICTFNVKIHVLIYKFKFLHNTFLLLYSYALCLVDTTSFRSAIGREHCNILRLGVGQERKMF